MNWTPTVAGNAADGRVSGISFYQHPLAQTEFDALSPGLEQGKESRGQGQETTDE